MIKKLKAWFSKRNCGGRCYNCVFAGHCVTKNFDTSKIELVLVGSPNVGKSSIFNILSHKYTEISNYPGTTVSVFKAQTEFGDIVDTPGIYSFVDCQSQDEQITQNFIKNSSVIINIVSALTLERDLILTSQLLERDLKIILVINQIDEAIKRGISIDTQKISKKFGIDVIEVSAKTNLGIDTLINSIQKALAEEEKFSRKHPEIPNKMSFIKETLDKAVTKKVNAECFLDKLGIYLFHPIIGSFIAIAILYILFKMLGVIIAGNVVDVLVSKFDQNITPKLDDFVSIFLPNGLLKNIFIGEFGAFTMGLKLIFAILLPLIIGYYIIISFLEDSGYLPRLAVLTDNFFSKIGLNGRAAIPILLGFGCGAMGILSTRILTSKKERIIASAIIAISIPCAAQQGIIMALLASVNSFEIWIIYLFTVLLIMVATGKILKEFIPGTKVNLLIDIPPLRLPSLSNSLKKTYFRSKDFLNESFLIFMISSVIITFLDEFHVLLWLQNVMAPIVENLLNLPKKFSDVLVLGIIRRDFAAVEILNMTRFCSEHMLSNIQILTSVVVITLFVPCVNAVMIILKERGVKEAILLWFTSFFISIFTGYIINNLGRNLL